MNIDILALNTSIFSINEKNELNEILKTFIGADCHGVFSAKEFRFTLNSDNVKKPIIKKIFYNYPLDDERCEKCEICEECEEHKDLDDHEFQINKKKNEDKYHLEDEKRQKILINPLDIFEESLNFEETIYIPLGNIPSFGSRTPFAQMTLKKIKDLYILTTSYGNDLCNSDDE